MSRPTSPVNIRLMDTESAVNRLQMRQVTSHNMFEATSTRFHPDGLYSEEIFGEIGSQQRMEYFGYIDLKARIIHPHIFKTILSLKKAYEGIISGRVYAIFDKTSKDFIITTKDTPGAETGYNFFISNVMNVEFQRTGSVKRDKKIALLKKYNNEQLFTTKYPVCPAGIRDVQVDENGMTSSEEINKLYLGLLSLSQALPNEMSEDLLLLYDSVRYSIQKKALEIWEYLWNIFTGNRGFAQNRHASRAITWGARNVISAAKVETNTPDDLSYLKHDETLVSVFQAMKMFQPMAIQKIRYIFLEQFFTIGASKVPLINPKTYAIQYVELKDRELARWNSKEGIAEMIASFEDDVVRTLPVSATGSDGANYYLYLVYDEGDEIYLFRNIDEFKDRYKSVRPNKEFDMSKVRPLSYIEMFYIAMIEGTDDKHTVNTRYPAVEAGSTYPSKVRIGSTVPSREVNWVRHMDDDILPIPLPRYPILGKPYLDSIIVHSSKLAGMGGDFDGDMISSNSLMTEEANAETTKYLQSPKSIVHIDGRFQSGLGDNLMNLIFFNLSRMPKNK